MDGNFKKIKKKYIIGAVLNSLLCALAAGLATAGIILLSLKLGGVEAKILFYLPAGIGAAVLCGAVAFFAMRPTDKKVARRIDEEYALNERAQTALAFGGKDGAVVEIQRAEAGEKLAALSVSAVKFSKIWKFLAAFAVALAIAVAGIAVPGGTASAGQGPTGDDIPAEITESQIVKLEELIAEVNKSRLGEDAKGEITEGLELLKRELGETLTNGELRTKVETARQTATSATQKGVNYAALAGEFANLGAEGLSSAIMEGGNTYLYYEALAYKDLDRFYKQDMYTGVDLGFAAGFDGFRETLAQEEGEEPAATCAKINAAAATLFGGLALALTNEEITSGLGLEMADFARGLNALAANVSAEEEELQNGLNDIFGKYKLRFEDALCVQTYSLLAGRYVRNALAQIFDNLGFTLELAQNRPSDGSGIGGEGGGQGDGTGNNEGGSGTGSMEGGSADEIYDPFTGSYRKYIDVINDYYAIVQELVNGGNITDEQRAAVTLYFEFLFGTKQP